MLAAGTSVRSACAYLECKMISRMDAGDHWVGSVAIWEFQVDPTRGLKHEVLEPLEEP